MDPRATSDLPPAAIAAARRTSGGAVFRQAERAYPFVTAEDDLTIVTVRLAATRALLTTTEPHEVAGVVATLIHDLGGGVVPARSAPSEAIPLDVSLGLTEPMLPWADPVSVASMRLARVLPGFLADARVVFDRLQSGSRLAVEAEKDSLTGLLTRRAWMRQLSAATPEDAVCIVDLDRFKLVNDTHGHAAGDEVLRSIGALLAQVLRPGDACGRLGGDELACLAVGLPAAALVERMQQLRRLWREQRPECGQDVGLSIGVAQVGERAPRRAVEAADRALYRVKAAGRDATALATDDDRAEGS